VYLLFRLKGHPFAVPASDTVEMVHGSRVTISPLPGGVSSVLGVFDNRGQLLPILDLRTAFGHPSFAAEARELEAMLAARERDHVAWVEELRGCASSGDRFTKATNPSQCAFGQWYDGLRGDERALAAFTGDRVALHAAVQALDVPHRAIHAIAERVLERSAAGDTAGALAIVESTSATHLSALRRLLKELYEQFVQQRQVMLVVIQAQPKNVAFAVDEVLAVQELDPERISDVPPTVRVSEAIVGLYRPDQGEVIQILDPAVIVRSTMGAAAA
jgi:chemotaxis signal transduction protein